MAAFDLQEQEQLEALKAWWKDNSKWLLGALLIVAVAIGGWRGWQYYYYKQATEAATLYLQFVEQIASNDAKRVNDVADMLINKYAATAYAPRAALAAAQVNKQAKDVARAKTQLLWVIEHASEPHLQDVAHLRLAALLLDEKSYDDALKQLEATRSDAFNGLYADLKGDVLSAQGKNAEAKVAYQLAYDKIDAKSTYRNLIQMKMDALGEAK
jgi:predicted negative regulator of RcsB-dependent stress response